MATTKQSPKQDNNNSTANTANPSSSTVNGNWQDLASGGGGGSYTINHGGTHSNSAPTMSASLDEIFETPMSMVVGGDVLVAHHTAIEEVFTSSLHLRSDSGYSVIPMCGSTHGLPIDSVIITWVHSTKVYIYTLMLDETLDENIKRKEFDFNNTSERKLLASDLYDNEFYQELSKEVSKTHAKKTIEEVGFSVIPRSIKASNGNAVGRVVSTVVSAINMKRLNGNSKANSFNSGFIGANGGLCVNMNLKKSFDLGADGLPVRGDAVIKLSLGNNSGNNSGVQTSKSYTEGRSDLTTVTSYVELLPVNMLDTYVPEWNYNQYSPVSPDQLATGSYLPRIVISSIEQRTGAFNLAIAMSSIASTYLLDSPYMWANSFLPAMGDVVSRKWHDIGGVGYERNLTNDPDAPLAPIRTDDASFDEAALEQMISAVAVSFSPYYSIDVVEGGLNSSALIDLVIATTSGADGIAANKRIIESIDSITGGKFTEMFGPNHTVVLPIRERVYVGSYTDSKGTERDIRDVDCLAILNGRNGDYQKVTDWRGSFVNSWGTELCRMAHREKLLTDICPNAKITGVARRVTFAPNIVGMIFTAMAQSNLIYQYDNQQNQNHMGQQGGFMQNQNYMGQSQFNQNQNQGKVNSGGNRMFG